MLSQSEASNAQAGRGSMAGHSGVTLWLGSGALSSQSRARDAPPTFCSISDEYPRPSASTLATWFGSAELIQAERLGCATKPSPSGGSAQFAQFDYSSAYDLSSCLFY